jgi:hypothetical protein
MKKLLLLFSLCCVGQINAQTWVTIPDANFVTYLQGVIPAAMSGNQMNTSSTLVTTTTHSIYVGGNVIADLTGVQYFSSLTYLHCGTNSLTTLPTLPNTLTYLNCSFNSINILPTLPNSITFLNCGNNSLTSLPSLPNSLAYLTCESNFLTSLPALPNTLKSLWCGSTYLTTLPSLPNSLTTLNCNNDSIHCFPIFPDSIVNVSLNPNPYNCLPNYILPAMNSYTTTPLCAAGNSHGCAIANGIEQISLNNFYVTVYPNPTNGSFTIKSNTTDKLNADLYDVNGRHVFSKAVVGTADIDANSLDNGVYTLTIKSNTGITYKKLIIAR